MSGAVFKSIHHRGGNLYLVKKVGLNNVLGSFDTKLH